MKPGPSPKPTVIKQLQGTDRADRGSSNEPQFRVPGRTPSPPDYLNEEAQDIWRVMGKRLLDAGLFTVIDQHALGMFCAACARWRQAERRLNETGPVLVSDSGNLYQNPLLHVANRAWEQMRKMFGEFGLTPAERSRLEVTVNESELSLAEELFRSVVE